MVYVPKWEELGEALAGIMKTGLGEDDAKRDICNAMADGNIRVRISHRLGPEWKVSEDVFVPPRLHPDDFCWYRSCWQFTNRPHRYELGLLQDLPDGLHLWDAASIELRTEDVTKVLCAGLEKTSARPETGARDESAISTLVASKRRRRNPKLERAQRAIGELFLVGVPDQAELSNKELCRAVQQHLGKRLGKAALPLDDTILRAAGRRK